MSQMLSVLKIAAFILAALLALFLVLMGLIAILLRDWSATGGPTSGSESSLVAGVFGIVMGLAVAGVTFWLWKRFGSRNR